MAVSFAKKRNLEDAGLEQNLEELLLQMWHQKKSTRGGGKQRAYIFQDNFLLCLELKNSLAEPKNLTIEPVYLICKEILNINVNLVSLVWTWESHNLSNVNELINYLISP